MTANIIATLLIISLLFFVVSREWRVCLIMLAVYLWQEPIEAFLTHYWKWGYVTLWAILVIALLLTLPRYLPLPSDRVRHYYINDRSSITRPPIHHWLLNALIPEEEICNIGLWLAIPAAKLLKVGPGLTKNLHTESKRGTLGTFRIPYLKLSRSFEAPMSAAYVQGLNQFAGENHKSFYLIRPKDYDNKKSYPLVIFCHGSFGNWKSYTGIFSGLRNCVVLCIGSRDLSGKFTENDLRDIFNMYIPLIERNGYKIIRENLTIMGLSKGGTSVNPAYQLYSTSFKNIVFISTLIFHTHPITSNILIIGGGEDPGGPSMKDGYYAITKNGGKAAIYWSPVGTHFIVMVNQDEIIDFLNKKLNL